MFKQIALTVHSVNLVSLYYKFFRQTTKYFPSLYITYIRNIAVFCQVYRDQMPKFKLHCTHFLLCYL